MKEIKLNMIRLTILLLLSISCVISMAETIQIEKDLLYNQHTLNDYYSYKDTTRQFQWDKIRAHLSSIDSLKTSSASWGVLQNYKNKNGHAPLVSSYRTNEYKKIIDTFNVEKDQGIPLYTLENRVVPERYGQDGALVKITDNDNNNASIKVNSIHFPGEWIVPSEYVHAIDDNTLFNKVIFVDRTNQNITTLEKRESKWLIRSMNPATTGLHHPPYQMETPLGIFVVQEKKQKMNYYKDGSTVLGGFAPHASRFSGGAYIHGIPIDLPRTKTVEISATLGTSPRSHKCVRNATSHAEFIYNWAPIDGALVFVID